MNQLYTAATYLLFSNLPGRTLIQWLCLVVLLVWSEVSGLCQSGALRGSSPPSLTVASAEATGFAADQLLAFAEQLMHQGEYFRAITEYRRFLFTYPGDARRAMAHFRIGLAFYRGESYGEALQTFREVTQLYPNTTYGKQAWLWQGESLARQRQYAAAEELYTEITGRFSHDPIGQQARYQRGWILLYQRQWRDAAAQFQQVAPESTLYPSAQSLAQAALEGAQLPTKSPALAGLLSGLLPGSGQLYNGRLGDAILAFFLNGLFIAGTVEAAHRHAYAVAGVLSFFAVGWYAGNIYGAVNGAHKYNRYTTETFLRNLDNRFHSTLPEVRAPQAVGAQFSLGF